MSYLIIFMLINCTPQIVKISLLFKRMCSAHWYFTIMMGIALNCMGLSGWAQQDIENIQSTEISPRQEVDTSRT